MAWIYIFVAGLFEVGWAIGLKKSDGFSRTWPTLWTIVAMILSFMLLGKALRGIPIGTAYAVWTGIGAAGTAIVGMVLFNEPANAGRVVCLVLIVAGIVGLKFLSPQ
jgi:quaternary ammonium compound-resistance protein SugE